MLKNKAYKFRIYPNKEQATLLNYSPLEMARFLVNRANAPSLPKLPR